MHGIILVDKEEGYTSRDVVNCIGKKFKTKKVGHTGTLDPLATGVLAVCVGRATKLVDLLQSTTKEYIAGGTLGILTDSLDTEGTLLKEDNVNISEEELKNTLNSMIGKYYQEVPIYSAVKVDGRKLYEYARNNEEVVLPKREVEIKEIELLEYEYINNKVNFKIRVIVSKGTYIRSLINDIGIKLNTNGIMTSLRRTIQGDFKIDAAYKLDEINNDNYKVLSISEVLKDIPFIIVNNDLENDLNNGKILLDEYGYDKVGFKTLDNKEIAIYQKEGKYLKPWKMLFLNKESD